MRYITILLLGILVQGCKTTKMDYTPDDYPGAMITFGNGGGFTGKVDRYVLLDNGQLFNHEAMLKTDSYQALPPVDKRTAEQLFANFYAFNLHKMILRDPADFYYFVEMSDEGKDHRLVWGGIQQQPAPIVKKYYMNLFQLAQRQKKTPMTR